MLQLTVDSPRCIKVGYQMEVGTDNTDLHRFYEIVMGMVIGMLGLVNQAKLTTIPAFLRCGLDSLQNRHSFESVIGRLYNLTRSLAIVAAST